MKVMKLYKTRVKTQHYLKIETKNTKLHKRGLKVAKLFLKKCSKTLIKFRRSPNFIQLKKICKSKNFCWSK